MKNEPFFDVKVDFFPENIYQGPIYAGSTTDSAQHLLFFTPVMKRQLEDCRAWFIDATFYIVNDPIKQVCNAIYHSLSKIISKLKNFLLAVIIDQRVHKKQQRTP